MKEFGIYTNDDFLYVITDINKEEIKAIKWSIENFTELTNYAVNEDLESIWNFFDDEIIIIKPIQIPILFNNHGYLGQISAKVLQEELRDYVEVFNNTSENPMTLVLGKLIN